uniref:Uncharacterized protein n=1 Tax=Panagrolaimus superbus TaxID=310955 RepID=A0A914YWY3_9BILA
MHQFFIGVFISGILMAMSSASVQSTAIRGSVVCGRERFGRVRLELWDKDRTDPDDLMMKPVHISYGDTFTLDGKENEISTIDPELRIFHKCGDERARCYKKSIILIPDEYVTKGERPKKIFMAGRIDLRNIKSVDTKEC